METTKGKEAKNCERHWCRAHGIMHVATQEVKQREGYARFRWGEIMIPEIDAM
jgi:hypothetical protein